jgi:Uma2 family endonuclease
MMALPIHPQFQRMSEADYLAQEAVSENRHEYENGLVFAMAGGSDEHAAITLNAGSLLKASVTAKGCRARVTDVLVKTGDGAFAYPVALVYCGEPIYTESVPPALLNPILIVEVLSPTTQGYDRRNKYLHYKTIPTLVDYLLIAQDQVYVELRSRRVDGTWVIHLFTDLEDTVTLESVNIILRLRDLYDTVFGTD